MGTVYRIRRWEETFENHRTRAIGVLRWCSVPNDLGSDGYTRLVEDKTHAAANYGVWIALICIASRCSPRGTLVRSSGEPHDPDSIARISRMSLPDVRRSWDMLVSIGWLEACGIAQLPAQVAQLRAIGSDGIGSDGMGSPLQSPQRDNGARPQKWTQEEVHAIYLAYPRHVAPQAAYRAIRKALKTIAVDGIKGDETPTQWLANKVVRYSKAWEGRETVRDGRDIRPYPATWFNAGRYDDDPDEWKR